MSYATNLNTYLNPEPQMILRRGNYGDVHYEEFICATTAPYPGMLVQVNANNTVSVQTSVGGDVPIIVAVEDSLQGLTINDQYTVNNVVRCLIAAPGHVIQGPIPAGAVTTIGMVMVSKGDGSWTPQTGLTESNLYVTAINSNTVTNTSTQTSFGQTYTVPDNSLSVGDILTIAVQGIATSTNSTDTLNVALKIGATTVATTGALDVANNNTFQIVMNLVVRSIGTTGAIIGGGYTSIGAPGTATETAANLNSTTINTTTTNVIDVLATWSVASASNIVQMNILSINRSRSVNQKGLGMAYTAVNNSLGLTYEFIDILIF